MPVLLIEGKPLSIALNQSVLDEVCDGGLMQETSIFASIATKFKVCCGITCHFTALCLVINSFRLTAFLIYGILDNGQSSETEQF
jgi:hypothetical protein